MLAGMALDMLGKSTLRLLCVETPRADTSGQQRGCCMSQTTVVSENADTGHLGGRGFNGGEGSYRVLQKPHTLLLP